MALGFLSEGSYLKFSRLRHQLNSSLCYHRRRECVKEEERNRGRLKDLAVTEGV